jgi:glycosyltransferase involved in cell wall biosynthesis
VRGDGEKTHNSQRISIVMAAHNEEPAIGNVLQALGTHFHEQEIIVVDDGSTDHTAEIAESAGVKVIRHPYNKGYGAALKTGIRAASGAVILTIDADGQHDAEDLLKLLPHIDRFDMVVGQRAQRLHSQLWRMPGKWLLTLLAEYLTRQKIPDLNSGMRAFRREVILRYLHLCPDRFSFSTTSTLVFFNRGYSVKYVPIHVNMRQGRSTVSPTTGFDTILLILRVMTLFEPLRLFVPVSLMLLAFGMAWGLPYLWQGRGISVGALLSILIGVQIFFFGLLTDQISQLRKERFE